MHRRIWLLGMACAIGICSSLQSQTDTSFSGAKQSKSAAKARPGVVKKLDGTKLFGFVEITDDYTIRITNESGIARLPIAQLSEADFQKYGFGKNRSQDGRFWYERKEALKTSEENPKSNKTMPRPGESLLRKSAWPKSRHFNPSSRLTKRPLLPRAARGRR